jgi:general secretion pathway protein I
MQAERGFTLLEVLVAFVIAALALGVLFQSIASGLGALSLADQYEQALSRARSRLAAVGAASLQPGVQSGDDGGGFRWQSTVAPIASAPTGGSPPEQLTLYRVGVVVSWHSLGRERQVNLESQRVASAQPTTR